MEGDKNTVLHLGLNPVAEEFHIYLKPIARVNLTVQLPTLHDSSGSVKSVTIWEIVEKLRRLCPGVLSPPTVIRVSRTTLEFVRLIADLEKKADVKRVVTSLDSQYIKLSGFPQNLSVRACETPADCPRRHDWEAFFRDAEDMDETQPGERPDTMILSGLPIRWFASPDKDLPSASVVKAIFENFGSVRHVDIPLLDPVQNPAIVDSFFNSIDQTKTQSSSTSAPKENSEDEANAGGGFGKIGPDTISVVSSHPRLNEDLPVSHKVTEDSSKSASSLTPLTFLAYVQFTEYPGFLKAMTALHGQKLVYAPPQPPGAVTDEKKLYYTAEIKVDFDRTKHLSRSSIAARQAERDRLLQLARRRQAEAFAAAEEERRQRRLMEDAKRKAEERRRAEELAMEAVRQAKKAAKAERKKQRAIEKCKLKKSELLKQKMELDERHRLLAIRKMESIHLVSFLLKRIQSRHDAIVEQKRASRNTRPQTPQPQLESPSRAALPDSLQTDASPAGRPVASSSSPECTEERSMLQQILRRREQQLREQLLRKRRQVKMISD